MATFPPINKDNVILVNTNYSSQTVNSTSYDSKTKFRITRVVVIYKKVYANELLPYLPIFRFVYVTDKYEHIMS